MGLKQDVVSAGRDFPARRTFPNPLHFFGQLSEGRRWAYYLIAPSLFLVLLMVIYPVVTGIGMSFQELRLNRPNRTGFVGFLQYQRLFSDDVFYRALLNTGIWVSVGVASQFALGLATALCLNRPLPGMKLARVLILLPWIMPTVVAGNMWALMLDSRLGVINDVLMRLGVIPTFRAWLADANTAFPSVLAVALWQGFPFFTLLLLAGLQGIPEDLYEAASVDGASRWAQFIHITMPLLTPVIVAVVVLRTIGLVNSPDLMIILTNGGPGRATEVLSSFAFNTAYAQFNFGYAGALSVVMLLMLMIFTVIYVRVSGAAKE
jgi:multiple sugar transport system permease protein